MLIRKKRLRPILLGIIATIIIAKIVALSPSSLEENPSPNNAVNPEDLVQDNEPSVVPGIPKNRVADYGVDKFDYVAVHEGEKQWKVDAARAFLYHPEKLVHARIVKAFLYDPDGTATVVTALEAKYFMNQKDLELYGQVHTVFPDGFELNSEYLRYKPDSRHIHIPTQYVAHGVGHEAAGQTFRFTSQGLDYVLGKSLITLPEAVVVNLDKEKPKNLKDDPDAGVPDSTTIESDHCLINRDKNLAFFTMHPDRPLKDRFVHITQPNLFARSRRATLHYGSFNQVLQYLTSYDDVLVKETRRKHEKNQPPSLRYATGGQADFDTQRDIIVLTKFPQTYQDEDTVTGDIILMHRDTDIIEVEHSNAFSEGSE